MESLWKELSVSPVMRSSVKRASVTTTEMAFSSCEGLEDQRSDRDKINFVTRTMALCNAERRPEPGFIGWSNGGERSPSYVPTLRCIGLKTLVPWASPLTLSVDWIK